MTKSKLLTAGLIAAAMLASPVMAQEYYPSAQAYGYDAYAGTDAYPAGGFYGPGGGHVGAYGAYASVPYGAPYAGQRGCRPAPRVGAFASQPWDNDVPCEPGSAY